MADSRDLNSSPNYRRRIDYARTIPRFGYNGEVIRPPVFTRPPPSQPSTTQPPTTQPLTTESTTAQRPINNLPQRLPNTPTDTSTATTTATKLTFPPGQEPTESRSKTFKTEDELTPEDIASGRWRIPPPPPPAPADPRTAYTGMRVQQLRTLAKLYGDRHEPTAQEKSMLDQAEEGNKETKK